MYTYNWSQELNLELDRQLSRLLQWQNARSHLLTCIVSQKMGLFQHNLFCEPHQDTRTQVSCIVTRTPVHRSVVLSPGHPYTGQLYCHEDTRTQVSCIVMRTPVHRSVVLSSGYPYTGQLYCHQDTRTQVSCIVTRTPVHRSVVLS